MLKYILFLAFVGTVSYGQITRSGSCPTNMTVVTGFNWTMYSGKWYSFVNIRNYQDLTGKCMTHTYENLPLDSATLTNFNYNITGTSNRTDIGKISIPDKNKGEYFVSFPTAPWWQSLKVQIIDTDYTTCAVAYACYQVPFKNEKLEYMWFKVRSTINTIGYPFCNPAFWIARDVLNGTGIQMVDTNTCPANY